MRSNHAVFGFVVLALAACSAASPTAGSAPGASPSDGGAPDSASPTPASGAFGTVVVRQMFSDPGGYSAGATAVFASARASDPSVTCTTAAAGSSCVLTTCNAFPNASATTSESAGDLAISGGSAPLTLRYQSDGSSYDDQGRSIPFDLPNASTTPLFAGGESLRVVAPGAKVPAFDATVTAPALVTMTAPGLDAKNNCPIASGKDYDFTWTGGAAGDTVEIVVHGADTNENVTCEFDATAGRGTVPYAGGLAKIEMDAAGNAFLYTSTVHRESSVRAGEYDVSLSAQALATACYVVTN